MALAPETTKLEYLDIVWMLIAASLVFLMNAGFAMLEAGLCQTRNSTNILAKNLIVFCVSILAFWLLGFGLMFGNGNSWLGQAGFLFQAFSPPFNNSFPASFQGLEELYPQQSFIAVFFFQLVFAGTAATIVSGAVAERIRFWAFFGFSFCLVGIVYPIVGHWVWSPDGWLAIHFSFLDFAGSTVVHSVGGMAGLVGAILVGPRRGWKGYNPDAIRGKRFSIRPKSFSNYNLTFSTLGCLILWLGWLGFNGGSARSLAHIPHIITTTMISASSGGIFVLMLRGLRSHKPALTSVINGILGGLVGITASSAYVNLMVALFIGAVSSLFVIGSEIILERCRIDDPVGAIPVHLACGIWGTLATGLFVNQLPPYINYPVDRIEQITGQIVGILAVNSTVFLLSLLFWLSIGFTIYCIDILNLMIKYPRNPLPTTINADDAQPKGFFQYLQFSTQALRVSRKEEAEGSDGTFVN